jgi:hypothetical protein
MKGLRLYLIGSAVVLVIYLVVQYMKPEPTDWTPTYLKEDKIPFGLYILDHELVQLFPHTHISTSRDPVYNTLKDRNRSHTNYLVVAGSLKFDKPDYQELVKFMNRGNSVFIAAFDIGDLLSDTLNLQLKNTGFNNDQNVPVSFVNPALKIKHSYLFTKGISTQYFSQIDTSRAVILGINAMGKANFVKYPFGRGALYILPNPQLLTNYSLLTTSGAEYAAVALSHLPVSPSLIRDEYYTRGSNKVGSPLQFLFDHEQLRLAYEIAVISLLIFVFFEMKRRQRVIPVIEPLKNSSADFVKVVGKVYYQQRDNRDIAKKKISYLLEYIRTAYRLKTTQTSEELIAALIIRSAVSEETIRQLFTVINELNQTNKVSDQQLIRLNKLIEKFHQQA